jgi:hypothetical protein
MAQVTIIIADTPEGGVSVQSDFRPTIGAPCSTAQAAALDIIGASALAGAGALAGLLSMGMVNRPLRVAAAGSAWLALFASGFLFATSSWS